MDPAEAADRREQALAAAYLMDDGPVTGTETSGPEADTAEAEDETRAALEADTTGDAPLPAADPLLDEASGPTAESHAGAGVVAALSGDAPAELNEAAPDQPTASVAADPLLNEARGATAAALGDDAPTRGATAEAATAGTDAPSAALTGQAQSALGDGTAEGVTAEAQLALGDAAAQGGSPEAKPALGDGAAAVVAAEAATAGDPTAEAQPGIEVRPAPTDGPLGASLAAGAPLAHAEAAAALEAGLPAATPADLVPLPAVASALGLPPYVLRSLLDDYADVVATARTAGGQLALDPEALVRMRSIAAGHAQGLSADEIRQRLAAQGEQPAPAEALLDRLELLQAELAQSERRRVEDRDRLLLALVRTQQEIQHLRVELSGTRRSRRKGFWARLFGRD